MGSLQTKACKFQNGCAAFVFCFMKKKEGGKGRKRKKWIGKRKKGKGNKVKGGRNWLSDLQFN